MPPETASAPPPMLRLCQSPDVSSLHPVPRAVGVNRPVWQVLVEPTLHVRIPVQYLNLLDTFCPPDNAATETSLATFPCNPKLPNKLLTSC